MLQQLSVARSQLQPWAGENYTTLRCVPHILNLSSRSINLDNKILQPVSQLIKWGLISGQILCGVHISAGATEDESQ